MKDKIELQQIQVFQACFLTINEEFWHLKEYRAHFHTYDYGKLRCKFG